MVTDSFRTPLKAALWEEAKGKLRAPVAVQGSYSSADQEAAETFEEAGAAVEAFIKDFENRGLHE